MTHFNFSLKTPQDIKESFQNYATLFSQIEVLGYFSFATEIYDLMQEQNLMSFKVATVSNDYEGGYEVRITDKKFSIPKTQEEISGHRSWDMADLLSCPNQTLEGDLTVALDPIRYEKKVFEQDIKWIMKQICTPQTYELWQALESKSMLNSHISTTNQTAQKTDFKI